MFEFTDEPVPVAGVDENGYGPFLGPLVVTRVDLAVDGDPWILLDLQQRGADTPFRDSKQIFRRSVPSYRTGERLALQVLRAAGFRTRAFHELVHALTGRSLADLYDPCPDLARWYPDLRLPVWLKHEPDPLPAPLAGVRVAGVAVEILTEPLFNQQVRRFGSKAFMDFWLFLKVLRRRVPTPEGWAFVGKIGGTRRYGPWFRRLQESVEVRREHRHHAAYRWHTWSLHFLQDADARWLPVAMASVVGKYLRELFMLALSRSLGYATPLPYASGYHHDAHSREIARKLQDLGLPEPCFRRSR